MIIIAVDPGKTCGYACWNDAERDRHGLVTSGQLESYEFLQWLEGAIPLYQVWGEVRIVGELFVIDESTPASDAHWAMYPLGCLMYWCTKFQAPFVGQLPSEAKTFATDDKLRNLGWHHPTVGGHENDALRHLVVYLVKLRKLDLSVLATGP